MLSEAGVPRDPGLRPLHVPCYHRLAGLPLVLLRLPRLTPGEPAPLSELLDRGVALAHLMLKGALRGLREHRRLGLVPVHLHGHHHRVQLPAAHARRVLVQQVRLILDSCCRCRLLVNEKVLDVDLPGVAASAPVGHQHHEGGVAHREGLARFSLAPLRAFQDAFWSLLLRTVAVHSRGTHCIDRSHVGSAAGPQMKRVLHVIRPPGVRGPLQALTGPARLPRIPKALLPASGARNLLHHRGIPPAS